MVSTNFKEPWRERESKPIDLYEFVLPGTGERIYLAANQPDDIHFDGIDYAACPIEREPLRSDARTSENSLAFRIGNVDQSYTALLSKRDVRGSQVILKVVFADLLDVSSEYYELFRGTVDRVIADELSIQLGCFSRHSFQHFSLPLRMYQQTCQWTFGDQWCGIDINTVATIPDSNHPYLPVRMDDVFVSTDPSEATSWSFVSNQLVQSQGHWDFGTVHFSQLAGKRVSYPVARHAVRFRQSDRRVYLDMPLDEKPIPGDVFSIIRGCPKTWEACALVTDAYYPLAQVVSGALATEPRHCGFQRVRDTQRKPLTFRLTES